MTKITDLFGHGESPAKKPRIEVESDFDFARENIRRAIFDGEEAMAELLIIMQQSQHPRAYEVFTTLMKEYVEANKSLLVLKNHNLKNEALENGTEVPKQINNNLFLSTAEVLKLLKGKQDEVK